MTRGTLTKWTDTLIPTQKQDPAGAELVSHKLLIRGGFIRQLQAGSYTFLPLGWRCLQKAMNIVREEINATGSQEIQMPVLQPLELWEKTGRYDDYGPDLLRAVDRHDRINPLAPTHEEPITEMIAAYVESYKQLPLSLYQIQLKFRDEPRPRSGLLRVREFIMKDAYTFALDHETLDRQYQTMYEAYKKIFARAGVPAIPIEAESGPIGGSGSHEFTVPCDAGEDIVLSSDKGNYAANVEKAETGERLQRLTKAAPTGELEKVQTPGMKTIADVSKFLKAKPQHILKTLLFKVTYVADEDGTPIENESAVLRAIVRGDHEVNTAKLTAAYKNISKAKVQVEALSEDEADHLGYKLGYVGPHAMLDSEDSIPGHGGVNMIIDFDVLREGHFWVAGANEVDHHVKHFDWRRDVFNSKRFQVMEGHEPGNEHLVWQDLNDNMVVADIRNAVAGDPSPKNDGGVLKESRGVEVGHVFKLGTKYSEPLGAKVLDKDGKQQPILMGCYGIGVGRILISAVETSHDDRGIIWPKSLAPYDAVITPIKYEGDVAAKCDEIAAQLAEQGLEVLLDNRDERPGVKFADADLIGIPLRIVVGDRGLADGVVELKQRGGGDATNVAANQIVAKVLDLHAEDH